MGRNFKTVLPDGTFTKTEWTAWQQQLWDNNDTVLLSQWYWDREGGSMGAEEQDAAEKAAAHANTPTIIHTDSLARGFYTIQILIPGASVDDTIEAIHSYETLDIQGNRLAVVDGRGLVPLSYQYNMLQAPTYQLSIDSGTGRTFLDVAGQPLYSWDAENRMFSVEYDELRRPTNMWVKPSGLAERLLSISHYGEGLIGDKVRNLRGQLYEQYDSSGFLSLKEGYDFKGNPIQPLQQLLNDPTLTDPDWTLSPALSPEVFSTTSVLDALNRPVTVTDPGGNLNAYFYDKGGVLKTVKLNGDTYVQDLHYDAKGQRMAIWYGNGTKTSYTYDALTFRLRRLLTIKLSTNEIFQDLNYWYDPIGNITQIQDAAQQTLYFNNTVVAPTQKYTYDALYRLSEAKGRELIGTATFGLEDNWNDNAWKTAHKGNGAAVQNYTQHYTYDEVGNILQLKHIATAGSYTRDYTLDTASNRMLSTAVGINNYVYTYDARGNMLEMPHLDAMHWNIHSELHKIENGTMQAHYQYSGGQRIRKYVDKINIQEERIYLGSFEIYRKFDGSSLKVERQTVHISDDTGRIAMLEKRTIGIDPSLKELTRYIYSNHLQSASLELDENANIISYEEYHPYGTTSYQAMNASIKATAKRYRYTGKERDEESGLYYHGARYYIPWLARWTAVDPSENKNTPKSSYGYCSNNPISKFDPDGKDEIHFNFLTIENKRNYYTNSNQDAFRPENFGIPQSDISHNKWVSVVKNDQPNTYHYHLHNLTTYDDGQQSVLNTRSEQLYSESPPNALFVHRDSKILYELASEFKGTLSMQYPQTFSNPKSKSQSNENIREIHQLMINADKYQKIKKQDELELAVFKFAVEVVATELLILRIAKGVSWITKLNNSGLDDGIVVSEATIVKALEGSTMKSTQNAISLPVIERYVKMLMENKVAPSIRVADDIIIEGNHRYIAGRLTKKEPDILPGTIAPSQKSLAKPIQEIKIDLSDWGNK